jgi:hypothetical protein
MEMHMKPEEVRSPKKRLNLIAVLAQHVDPNDPDHKWSLALCTWDNVYRIGIRWDGKGKLKGNPTSHGQPTWYLLPDQVVDAVMPSGLIPADKLQLVTMFRKAA